MFNIISEISENYIIVVALTAWFVAQVLKTIINFALTRDLNIERLVGAGGMPSSHTALVTSLVIATAQVCGLSSPVFALAMVFACVVMYDAMGVRRAAGEQARIINKMLDEWLDSTINTTNEPQVKQLKELLGHTPLEVFGGVIVGIIVAVIL